MATAATGPVPFKDVDDDGIDFSPRVLSPKEEFADLVASLLRKQLFMDGRLYQLGHSPRCRLIRLLAAFVGRPFTAAEEAAGAVASVIELCSFDRMKGLEVNKRSGTPGGYKSIPRDAFFRKGVNGDCANHMSPETAARLDGIFCDKFRGTGLAIPTTGSRHEAPQKHHISAMSPTNTGSGKPAGPIPFKDIIISDDDGDDNRQQQQQPPVADEYRDVIAALPCRLQGTPQRMRLYEGAWYREDWVPGIIAFHRRFVPRDDGGDVILASLPKCGTTWLKALAFAVAARGAYPPAGDVQRHPLARLSPHDCVPFVEAAYFAGEEARLEAAPSPRLMSTHASYSVLPASMRENPRCKVIYICRQPKDMLISYWHFMNRSKFNTMSFSDVWKSIPESTYFGSPIWEHILGYWNASKMNPDRVLFLKYEDVLCDPIKNIERIAEFIGQPFSEAEKKAGIVGSIINLCSLQNLKALDPNNIGFRRVVGIEVPNGSYFRKGKVGDWVNYVTPEMAESLDKFLCDKFHGTGFAFTD
uniref:Sulfotransferase n=1 Tax=Leersia perrieri TaxID=77586 RepID=A0A0D9X1A3_9ORYZ